MKYKIQQFTVRLVRDRSPIVVAKDRISDASDAFAFFEDIRHLPHEEFHVLYLNGQNQAIGRGMAARGGQHGCALGIGDIYRGAIAASASAIICAHNHPSGNPLASADDLVTTLAIRKAGELLGIPLLDHVIMARDGQTSIDNLLGKSKDRVRR